MASLVVVNQLFHALSKVAASLYRYPDPVALFVVVESSQDPVTPTLCADPKNSCVMAESTSAKCRWVFLLNFHLVIYQLDLQNNLSPLTPTPFGTSSLTDF